MTYKHPATAVGWSLLQAADAAAARAAIGIDASTATATNQYAVTIGNGSATSIAVTHGLGTRDVVVSVYDVATGEQVECDVVATTGNVVTLTFATAPATNTLRCVVLGTAFGLGASGATTSGAITDATTVGRQVLTAANGTAARAAIGAGTSDLAIGTTSLTAKAGDYQPSSSNISDATAVGRSLMTAADAAAARTILQGAQVFSTADYAQGSGGDDRARVTAAVNAAVSAITTTGEAQTVLIHAPLVFKTGTTLAGISGSADPNASSSKANQGVQLPVNLAAGLHIVFAPGAKITLTANCRNAFCIKKVADYDEFRHIYFYNAWVDGNNIPVTNLTHGLVGNAPNGSFQMYLSFTNIKFYGKTKFTNFYSDATDASPSIPNDECGQLGIMFLGFHNGPLESTHTFSTNIYLEDGEQYGGRGLFNVCAIGLYPGGVNHYHNDIVVGRWRYVNPQVRNGWGGHTGIFICGPGYGDYAYIGPGYCENTGDDAIEVGPMQNLVIEQPTIVNPWLVGILIRSTHAPMNIDTQKTTIRGLRSKLTTAITSKPMSAGYNAYPIGLAVDHQVIDLTSTATSGTFTLTVPGKGTTGSLNWNATAAQVVAALVAIGCTGSHATGGPLGTGTMTVWIGCGFIKTATTFTSSLSGGTLTLALSEQNASIGTVLIEDMTVELDGLSHNRHPDEEGLVINGLEFPHKKIEIVRPTIHLSNYAYETSGVRDASLFHPAAPFPGWNTFVLRDYQLILGDTVEYGNGPGNFIFFSEVSVDGKGTVVDIDGMASDRAAAGGSGQAWMVSAARFSTASNLRLRLRNLWARTASTTRGWAGANAGVCVGGAGTITQVDVFDSDFSTGTGVGWGIDLSTAAANTEVVRADRNLYRSS